MRRQRGKSIGVEVGVAQMGSKAGRGWRRESLLISGSANVVLQRLSRSDKALLEPGAEQLHVRRGTSLIRAGEPLDAIYFPETALLAISDGGEAQAEVAIVGREGFAGWSLLLGAERSGYSAHVNTRDGIILKVAATTLAAALVRSSSLLGALLPFLEALTVQMGCSIQSSAHDHINVRIVRWLLMRHDRVGGDELLVRHDEIAASLGVRRASVTDALHVLEGDLLIRCRRGRILIRDRRGLESMAALSYGGPEACYRSLFGAFGKCEIAALSANGAA